MKRGGVSRSNEVRSSEDIGKPNYDTKPLNPCSITTILVYGKVDKLKTRPRVTALANTSWFWLISHTIAHHLVKRLVGL